MTPEELAAQFPHARIECGDASPNLAPARVVAQFPNAQSITPCRSGNLTAYSGGYIGECDYGGCVKQYPNSDANRNSGLVEQFPTFLR